MASSIFLDYSGFGIRAAENGTRPPDDCVLIRNKTQGFYFTFCNPDPDSEVNHNQGYPRFLTKRKEYVSGIQSVKRVFLISTY